MSSAPTTISDGTFDVGQQFDHAGIALGQHATRGARKAGRIAMASRSSVRG